MLRHSVNLLTVHYRIFHYYVGELVIPNHIILFLSKQFGFLFTDGRGRKYEMYFLNSCMFRGTETENRSFARLTAFKTVPGLLFYRQYLKEVGQMQLCVKVHWDILGSAAQFYRFLYNGLSLDTVSMV